MPGTRSQGVELGSEKNLKRSSAFVPRTTFPRGLRGPSVFLQRSHFLVTVNGFSDPDVMIPGLRREHRLVGLVPSGCVVCFCGCLILILQFCQRQCACVSSLCF